MRRSLLTFMLRGPLDSQLILTANTPTPILHGDDREITSSGT